ncbi:Proteophosphoglycan ppg4 [Rhodotorula toruloides ATCC 204091]|uniref:BY PROTMAP: gi/342319759/gb/EGU11706.1/ Proteophosphoglycan ppg4 [Rhodotorula glutinis ATCC 204091] n=1 Tax=Rhodotorula toruloides TaxID=5286 RepID=A0A0K3CGH9_RHOTO|nr:Proteophosphoglycan ppg4 [Rhodotorula toruloides ATCC 204091]
MSIQKVADRRRAVAVLPERFDLLRDSRLTARPARRFERPVLTRLSSSSSSTQTSSPLLSLAHEGMPSSSSTRSRIPRSTGATGSNENAPPVPSLAGKSTRLAGVRGGSLKVSKIPLVPSIASSTASGSARTLRKTASQATIVIRRDSPSGDEQVAPSASRDEQTSGPKVRFNEAEDDQEQMPTPPNSQSPPGKKTTAAGKGKGKAELLAPSSSQSQTRSSGKSTAAASRRTSRSPIPPGPSHAPQVLAARRRSSVSPLPATATTSTAAPVPSTSQSSQLSQSSRRTRARPRPSETLPVAIVISSDDESEPDELLLLPAEKLRGRGEGKQRVWRAHRETSARPVEALRGERKGVKKELSVEREQEGQAASSQPPTASLAWDAEPVPAFQPLAFNDNSAAPNVEEAAPAEAEQVDGYGADLGGFDGHNFDFDADAIQFGDTAVEQPVQDAAVDDEIAALSKAIEDVQQDQFLDLQEQSSGSDDEGEADPAAVMQASPARSTIMPDAADSDVSSADKVEVNEVDAPTSSFFHPSASVRGARPSYPPLSPNRTGQYDLNVPVRLDSSPTVEAEAEVEDVKVEDLSQEAPADTVEAGRPASAVPTAAPASSKIYRNSRLRGGEVEQSREYHQFAGLEASSPMVESVKAVEENVAGSGEGSEEDEDDEEVVLVGQESQVLERSRSKSASPDASPPPPTVADRSASSPSPVDEVQEVDAIDNDERMASPAASMRSFASPARSANGDVLMSSPAASIRSVVMASPSLDRRQQESTPASKKGKERASLSPLRSVGGSPLKARIGEFVEGGRTKLQGLLFGPRASTPRVEDESSAGNAGEVVSPPVEPARGEQTQTVEQDEDEDGPFSRPHLHPQSRTLAPDLTFPTLSHSRSNASLASNTSTRSSRRRRPSHPSLPVIEVSSTDARAAARAAAILKIYHKYVEQGIESVPTEKGDASQEQGALEEDEEDEEELRTLLLDAEDEVREQIPLGKSPAVAASATAQPVETVAAPARSERDSTAGLSSVVGERWTSQEWRRLEQTLVELGRRQRRGTSVVSVSMTSESIAAASVIGEDVETEDVVEAFLRKWGVSRDECVGEWAWDKLVVRVDALKARRAKDARSRRAESAASSVRPVPALAQSRQEPLEAELRRASSPAEQEDSQDDTPDALVGVKAEPTSDDEERHSASASDEAGESSSADEHDETFFAPSSSRRERRIRRESIEAVYLPTALANPALRHLYDDTPPEKPKVPLQDTTRDESPSPGSDANASDSVGSRESTPSQPDAPSNKFPGSASRLFSYLGSFVRRSPAPSPSSTRATAPASASASPGPEMQQIRLSSALVTPQFAETSKPYPPIPSAISGKPLPHLKDRKILPLPPSHFPRDADDSGDMFSPVASTSRVTLDEDANESTLSLGRQPTRRRRSSGNGERSRVWDVVNAIEEAESSREEEEARIIELLQTSGGGAKRRAAGGDLRQQEGDDPKGKGKAKEWEWRKFVEIDKELQRTMIPTGTRALDRRVSGERRASRR